MSSLPGDLPMTFVLGLTGGIATGKSTADQFFRKQQIPVIDADKIAHEQMNIGQPSWAAIKDEFGPAYFNPDQTLNRQKLGQLVFEQPVEMKRLNRITHPLIRQAIFQRLRTLKERRTKIIVIDMPLLFESHSQTLCDQVLVITLPEEVEIKRLMRRNHFSRAEARERIKSQMPLQEKEAKADYVIANTGTIKELEAKLAHLLAKIEAEM